MLLLLSKRVLTRLWNYFRVIFESLCFFNLSDLVISTARKSNVISFFIWLFFFAALLSRHLPYIVVKYVFSKYYLAFVVKSAWYPMLGKSLPVPFQISFFPFYGWPIFFLLLFKMLPRTS